MTSEALKLLSHVSAAGCDKSLRGWQALLLLGVVHRLLHANPQPRIRRRQAKCHAKERELKYLREQIEQLRGQTEPNWSRQDVQSRATLARGQSTEKPVFDGDLQKED